MALPETAAGENVPKTPDSGQRDNLKRKREDDGDKMSLYYKRLQAARSNQITYRGVIRNPSNGQYEATLFDEDTWCPITEKMGRSVFLGYYNDAKSAAQAYDLGAIKYWGATAIPNFPVSAYHDEILNMQGLSRDDYVRYLVSKSHRIGCTKMPRKNLLEEMRSEKVNSDKGWLTLGPSGNELAGVSELAHNEVVMPMQCSGQSSKTLDLFPMLPDLCAHFAEADHDKSSDRTLNLFPVHPQDENPIGGMEDPKFSK